MNFAHCLRTVLVIGKYADAFREDFFPVVEGQAEGTAREDLLMEEFIKGERISMKGALNFPPLKKIPMRN